VKIICPKCERPIPPEGVNVAEGVAYCGRCGEGFDLGDLVEGETPRVERPADAKTVLTNYGDRLGLVLPRGGSKGIGCFFLFFALFWNAITWTFVVMAVLSYISGEPMKSEDGEETSPVFILLFMIPFILVGIGTAVVALFCFFGETSLAMDRNEGILRRRLFGFKWDRRFQLANVTDVKITESYRQGGSRGHGGTPVYGVGIHVKGRWRPVIFGAGLAEDEKQWLVGEVHAFWREMTAEGGRRR